MKKRIFSIALACSIILSAFSAGAAFPVKENPREIPLDVYKEPYMENQFFTVYAPWLRNFHLMSTWEYENGIFGGEACQQIRQAEISPFDSNTMYFGTDTCGLYKTTNGGKSWYSITNGAPGHCTKGLMCDVLDKDTLYVAYRSVGFFRSKDGGRTWEHLLADGDTKKVVTRGDTIVSDAAGNMFLAASSGVYRLDRKTDTLVNLTPDFSKYNGLNGPLWYDLDVSPDGQHIYACCIEDKNTTEITNGIYTSHDGGKTWSIKGTDPSKNVVYSPQSVALHPENPMMVFTSGTFKNTETGKSDSAGLYVSEDGGETFTHRYGHVYENLEEGVKASIKPMCVLEFGPKNADGIYPFYYSATSSTYPLHVSYDYGYTYEQVYKKSDRIGDKTIREDPFTGKTYTGWSYQAYDPDPNIPGRVIFAASGMYERSPEGTIKRINSGNSGAAIVDIAFSKSGKMFMCTTDVGTHYQESEWNLDLEKGIYPTFREGVDSHFTKVLFDPNDENHIILYDGASNGKGKYFGIWQSYTGGNTADAFTKCQDSMLPATPPYNGGNIEVLEYDPDNSNIIYGSRHCSFDNGKTWVQNKIGDEVLYISDISDQNPNYFVGVTGTGADTTICVSHDRGKTWEKVMKLGFSNFYQLFIDGVDNTKLWYVKKADFGKIDLDSKQIAKTSTLLGHEYFQGLWQNPKDPNHMLITNVPGIGTLFKDYKLAESTDNGKTWHVVPGLWSADIQGIEWIPNSTQVWVFTMAGIMVYDYQQYWNYLNSKVTITVDDKVVSYSEQPVITNGRVMVPMRELFEQLGATVNYNAETGVISASKNGNYVTLSAGNTKATVNGKEYNMDAAPYITAKGRTMVPLRFASEALSVGVGWDSEARMVYVNQ